MHRLQDAGRNSRAANSLSRREQQYRGRFAPSPTGPLHFGSLVAAMAAYLQARQQQGHWFLRIDDIDPPREQPGATEQIIQCLHAHGFRWDEEVQFQSRNSAAYELALRQLRDAALSYNCICSRKQIAAVQAVSADGHTASPVYPGSCRHKQHPASNAAVRLRVHGTTTFDDQIQGRVHCDLERQAGDFILRRRDGLYSYQLANVVDDAATRISEIVRGADLLDNTPKQLALIQALGLTAPKYAHIPVALNTEGGKLSKQSLAPALEEHRKMANLHAAWRFLGQPESTFTTGARGRPADSESLCDATASFWARAVRDWDIRRVPRRINLPMHADTEPSLRS